jgi:menaquinone-9 beta-reductase
LLTGKLIFVLDNKQFDVVICGAGPAGCTAALALADSGLKVAVLEKHKYPRDKVCGDAIAAYVPNVLNSINPKFRDALSGFKASEVVNICRIVAPNEKAIDVTYKKGGFISKRIDWDNFLFELAASEKNITFFLGHSVSEVTVEINRKEASVLANGTSFKCSVVIGCDGAHSVVKKYLQPEKLDLDHHAGAVRAYFKNVSGIPEKTFELHFLKGLLPGYFWIFPLPDNTANVGLGLLSSRISKKKVGLREKLNDIITGVPYVSERFKHAEIVSKVEGFGLPLGSRKVSLSGDHFLLCGDAGCLIDPLSGEGIGQAMVSGRYAGWHARKCFDENNFSAGFMRAYDDQVYRKFWARHRKDYWVQKLISDREWLFNGIFNAGTGNTFIRKLLVQALM